MTISYSYLVLNDKNIKKLQNKFNLDIDDILHFARNGDINLYIRVENINAGTIIKTEFDECFSLSSFVNSDKKARCYKDFFNVADYNVDRLTEEDKESYFGFIYESEDEPSKEKGKLSMICFDGFIQIPSRTINESARKIILDEFSAYYFLRDEYGETETDFILNFSFPNKSLQVPIQNTYILIPQLSEVVADELDSSQIDNNGYEEIKKLKSELEEKQKIIDSLSLTNQSGRISSPQKQLFALLVKKCYPKLDSRNKLFDVINADLKESGIRNTNIAADTFYKLIDESNDIIKAIFPPKKS